MQFVGGLVCLSAFLLSYWRNYFSCPSYLSLFASSNGAPVFCIPQAAVVANHHFQSFGGHGPNLGPYCVTNFLFHFRLEVHVTYSGWLALLFSAFHLVLHKLFITSPEAGVARGKGEWTIHLDLGHVGAKLTTDWRFRGPGRWRPSSNGALVLVLGGYLTCFVIFLAFFLFLPLGWILSVSCYFFYC